MTKEQIWKAIEAYRMTFGVPGSTVANFRGRLDAELNEVFDAIEALQSRVAELEAELGSSAVYTLNELQAKICGLAGERDRLKSELAALRAQEPVAYMSSRTGATVTKAQRQCMQNNGEYNKPLVFAAPIPPVQGPLTLPSVCDGKEQKAFKTWAQSEGLDVGVHYLHYLFINSGTHMARQAWKAAINYCEATIKEQKC